MSDTTITPEERASWRERLENPFSCHDAKHGAFTLRLLTALKAAEVRAEDLEEEFSAYDTHDAVQALSEIGVAVCLSPDTTDYFEDESISAVKALVEKAEQAEAENARLTAQLAALAGQQEDCKLHPCPYSREGLNCGVISLANNRAYEGMVENTRLRLKCSWLAACCADLCDEDEHYGHLDRKGIIALWDGNADKAARRAVEE